MWDHGWDRYIEIEIEIEIEIYIYIMEGCFCGGEGRARETSIIVEMVGP